jgi:hypothetical protein
VIGIWIQSNFARGFVTEATRRQSIASAGFSVAGELAGLFETATFLHSVLSRVSPQLVTEHRFLFPVFLQTAF